MTAIPWDKRATLWLAASTAGVRTGTPGPTLRNAVEFVASSSPIPYAGSLIEMDDGTERWRGHEVKMLVSEFSAMKLRFSSQG